MSTTIAGAWEAMSDSLKGYMVCTETHYSMLCVTRDRKPFLNDEPTQAEEAEAFRSIRGGSGTYQVTGSQMVLNEEADRNPSGHQIVSEIKLEGDLLIETSVGPDNPTGESFTWIRVG